MSMTLERLKNASSQTAFQRLKVNLFLVSQKTNSICLHFKPSNSYSK